MRKKYVFFSHVILLKLETCIQNASCIWIPIRKRLLRATRVRVRLYINRQFSCESSRARERISFHRGARRLDNRDGA